MPDTRDYNGLNLDQPGRGRIYDSILETIANTPLVRIPRISEEEGLKSDLLLKLEFFNPLASVKDRIAVGMITALEQQGKIGPGTTLVEPTSGNTGIGLAFVAASRADPASVAHATSRYDRGRSAGLIAGGRASPVVRSSRERAYWPRRARLAWSRRGSTGLLAQQGL